MLMGDSLFKVQWNTTLSQDQLNSLIELYQPIIGSNAILLYLTLTTQKSNSFQVLSDILQMDVIQIEKARETLEEFKLIDTYQNLNQYILVIHAPLNYQSFIKHEVYGRFLLHRLGKEYYQSALKKGVEYDLEQYHLISKKLETKMLNDWSKSEEDIFVSTKDIKKKASFTYSEFFNGISDFRFPLELRTTYNMDLILEMSDLYQIPMEDIRKLALRSIEEDEMIFDEEKFKYRVRNYKGVSKEKSHEYDMPSVQYLAQFQKSGKVADSSMKLIESLKEKYNLKNEVINVLIKYVLGNYNMELNRNILDSLAAKLDRLQVQDYKTALEALSKEKKAVVKPKAKELNIEYINSNPTQKKEEELEDVDVSALMERLGKL